jgi:putative ABC transport system substrate-binding protein
MAKAFLSLTLFLIAAVFPAQAAERVYRLGALVASDQFVPAFEGLKKRMAEMGYEEGTNIRYEFYNANADTGLLKELAWKIVRSHPALIATSSTSATVPIAEATRENRIPVVFLSSGDPLRVVKSYASSGNNLTGISSSSLDLIEKRMELLKEVAPQVKRVMVLASLEAPYYEKSFRVAREAARKLGFEANEVRFKSLDEFKETLEVKIDRKSGDAVFISPGFLVSSVIDELVPVSIQKKLPLIGANVEYVRRGALAGYSSDYFSLGRQGALLVDKILRGAKPSDLPIEQPFRLNLVVNLKTANAIGLRIPKEILLRADEVIE